MRLSRLFAMEGAMDARIAFYQFVEGLINLVTNSNGLWRIVGPFVMMLTVVKVIRWAWTTARKEKDYDEMAETWRDSREALGRANRYGEYRQLQRMGFSRKEIIRAQNQRAGTSFKRRIR